MKLIKLIISTLILALLFAGCSLDTKDDVIVNTEDVSICFVNSGKSDSILIKAFGKAYLIDTGTKDSVESIKKALEKNQVSSIDAVFLTHTHKDHIGGLKKLSKSFDIPIVYSAEISMNEEDGTNKIEALTEEKNLKHEKLRAGDKININDDVYFEVLAPLIYNSEDDNDNSLVLRLSVYGKTALFTGDMQFAEEESLLKSSENLKADILKVGNHGNKDASSEEFVKAVSPDIAVITTNRKEDSGTASKRVRALFSNNLYITDEYDIGFLVVIKEDGTIEYCGQ